MAYKIPAASSGISFIMRTLNGNPADSSTYFLCMAQTTIVTTVSSGRSRIVMPKAGTITAAYGQTTNQGTLGSAEDVTIALRLNDTSNTNVTTTLHTNATSSAFSNAALSLAVSAGDFIDVLMITPAWATNPTIVSVSITFVLT